jgi:hypothetical protein
VPQRVEDAPDQRKPADKVVELFKNLAKYKKIRTSP